MYLYSVIESSFFFFLNKNLFFLIFIKLIHRNDLMSDHTQSNVLLVIVAENFQDAQLHTHTLF